MDRNQEMGIIIIIIVQLDIHSKKVVPLQAIATRLEILKQIQPLRRQLRLDGP